jgi:hypothetical protein
MNDGRGRTEAGPLALARRLLGRVIDTVRGSEPPPELVPRVAADPRDARPGPVVAREREAAPREAHLDDELREDRVVELPAASAMPAADEPARALLSDASWSGLRFEPRDRGVLLAWRDVAQVADVLRTIEIRCDYGALDAAPEITVRDRPVSATLGATSVASDAHRLLVALGTIREGAFVSVAHATVR